MAPVCWRLLLLLSGCPDSDMAVAALVPGGCSATTLAEALGSCTSIEKALEQIVLLTMAGV